jgi:tetraacyldisaccharide 4'-kinase
VRAPVIDQVRHADALIVVGEGNGADPMIRLAARAAKPIHLARFQPRNAAQFLGQKLPGIRRHRRSGKILQDA